MLNMQERADHDKAFCAAMVRDLKNFTIMRNGAEQKALSVKDDTLLNAPLPNSDPFMKHFTAMHRKDKDNEWKRVGERTFKMQHYAGEVYYDVYDWFSKNNAKLADEVQEMLQTSSRCFPKEFMDDPQVQKQKPYILENFTLSLDTMMSHLESSNCTFVRCIKSNTFKARGVFQGYLVLNQLRYTGTLWNFSRLTAESLLYWGRYDGYIAYQEDGLAIPDAAEG